MEIQLKLNIHVQITTDSNDDFTGVLITGCYENAVLLVYFFGLSAIFLCPRHEVVRGIKCYPTSVLTYVTFPCAQHNFLTNHNNLRKLYTHIYHY